jgi:hypothetical protein
VVRRALLLLAVAGVVAGADLAHKAHAIAERGDSLFLHDRSAGYVAGVTLAAALWCGAILLVRSLALALVGGLLLGGAAGNALSWILWPALEGTPNPWMLGDEARGLAFNLADVVVVGSILVALPVALTVYALQNRDRLRERVTLTS